MSARKKNSVVTLTGGLDIANVGVIKTALTDALATVDGADDGAGEKQAIRLDGSAVSRCDAAGLQLLLAFAQQCERQGQAWQWAPHSQVLQTDASGLGLARELQLHSDTQGGQ
jgi:anti-anti-sigma regulatory factor